MPPKFGFAAMMLAALVIPSVFGLLIAVVAPDIPLLARLLLVAIIAIGLFFGLRYIRNFLREDNRTDD